MQPVWNGNGPQATLWFPVSQEGRVKCPVWTLILFYTKEIACKLSVHYGHLPVKPAWTRQTWPPAVVSGTEISALNHRWGEGGVGPHWIRPVLHSHTCSIEIWGTWRPDHRFKFDVVRPGFFFHWVEVLVLVPPCPLSVLLVVDKGQHGQPKWPLAVQPL